MILNRFTSWQKTTRETPFNYGAIRLKISTSAGVRDSRFRNVGFALANTWERTRQELMGWVLNGEHQPLQGFHKAQCSRLQSLHMTAQLPALEITVASCMAVSPMLFW